MKGPGSVFSHFRESPGHVRLGILFLSGFGSGFSPLAPGTSATLFAWGGTYMFSLPFWGWGTLGAVIFFLGTILLHAPPFRPFAREDASWIVVDEISAFYMVIGIIAPRSFLEESVAFLTFRLVDALKPPPLRWLERIPSPALGVMLDDIGALGWTILFLLGARACGL
jgi:phosphatidylglycerophosphatase A